MQTYYVDVTYTFTGCFAVAAESSAEAERKIRQACGLVLGGNVHTTLEDVVINWQFDPHPRLDIIRVALNADNTDNTENTLAT